MLKHVRLDLTDGIFETGAYGVPSKSQNPTVLGHSGSSGSEDTDSLRKKINKN